MISLKHFKPCVMFLLPMPRRKTDKTRTLIPFIVIELVQQYFCSYQCVSSVKVVLINVDYPKLGRTVKMSALWFFGLVLWISIGSGKILVPAQN